MILDLNIMIRFILLLVWQFSINWQAQLILNCTSEHITKFKVKNSELHFLVDTGVTFSMIYSEDLSLASDVHIVIVSR